MYVVVFGFEDLGETVTGGEWGTVIKEREGMVKGARQNIEGGLGCRSKRFSHILLGIL